MSKTQRLFVGNLPPNIVDQELKNEFSAYGKVKEVEVKHKRSPDDEIINTFAFLYIDIDGHSLKQCLQEFKNEKYKGRFLNVTVARENFLDKLKREREEAAKSGAAAGDTANTGPIELVATRPALPVLPIKPRAQESSSSEDDSSSEDEKPAPRNPFGAPPAAKAKPVIPDEEVDEDGNLLLRKRSKAFVENGRIRIDARSSSGAGAIHVIERNKKEKKQFEDDKSKEADKKRLESLIKMKDTYNQQKLAIKNALSGVDSNRSNKIVFDPPAVSANTKSSEPAKRSQNNKPLFDDNDDEEDYSNDFRVKEQFQGEKGAQLMKLQSRFQNDKRFDMDSKFWEEGEDTGEYAPEVPAAPQNEDDADDERQWQYGILESVMGKRIQAEPAHEKKNALPQTMPRYDPTKQDHTKYLAQGAKRKPEPNKGEPKTKKSKQDEPVEPAPGFEVSKEQFYKVNKNLTSTLLKAGDQAGGQFSLLSMFGTAPEADASAGVGKNSYREKLIATNSTQKVIEDMTNPFKYDSSDDEQEVPDVSKAKVTEKTATTGKVLPKSGTAFWHETFFIHGPDDERMKEGLKFFLPVADANVGELDMEVRQKEMRNILKKKVKRSIKSVLPHGAKPNKRFRKFVRNL